MDWERWRWTCWRDAFQRGQLKHDLDEELAAHLALEIRRRIDAGESPEAARTAALREMGSLTSVKEVTREVWAWTSFERVAQDVSYALRLFRRSPAFAAVIVLSLALGIGANTAMFTLLDAIVLKTIPVEDPRELVVFGRGVGRGLSGVDDAVDRSDRLFSYPLYKDLRDDNEVFEDLAAIGSTDQTAYIRQDTRSAALPEPATTRLVSGNYFSTLGVKAALGRTIEPSDDNLSDPRRVLVLSHAYWQQRFASDPKVLGTALVLNGQVFTIIGVTPKGFRGETVGSNPDLFVPLALQQEVLRIDPLLSAREWSFLLLIGRLKDGVKLDQAEGAMTLQFQQALRAEAGGELSAERERRLRERRIWLMPGQEGLSALRRTYELPLLLLMAVVGLVQLIACANVANLLLARATARRKEIGVRLALGAGRARLIRQLLTESLLLSAISGALGLGIAAAATKFLASIVYGGESVPIDIVPDARVLAFTLGLSLLTALLFGLMPAFRATRIALASALQVSARGNTRRFDLSKGLVVVQVSLSLVLLAGAGLFAGSLQRLRGIDLGYQTENVLIVRLDPRGVGYSNDRPEELRGLYRRILERVRAIPGVETASLSLRSLLDGSTHSESVQVEGYTFRQGEPNGVRQIHITPAYFATLRMPIVQGRGIDEGDRENRAHVAVVNQRFADRFFSGRPAVGGHLSFEAESNMEIVGVVANAKYNQVKEKPSETVFLPVYQMVDLLESLEIRSRPGLLVTGEDVRRTLSEVDRNLPIRSMTTLTEQVDRGLGRERLLTTVTSFFGVLALVLAAIGLFGVMSYAVSQRTNEIGIRMALGAERRSVLWMVLRESFVLVIVGITAGVTGTMACARLVASLLYDISPTDTWTISLASLILVTVASLAAYLPARRAARVDPIVALKYE